MGILTFPSPLAYSSIKVYLSGIRTSLIHFGFTFPPYSEMPLLERQLIGYRRIRHTVRRTQKPLTPHILNHLSSCLGTTSDDLVMWAALTCGVYGLFRTGELTITSRMSRAYNDQLAPWKGQAIFDCTLMQVRLTSSDKVLMFTSWPMDHYHALFPH